MPSTHELHYGRLALMAALSFVAMYALMYAMVDVFGNVYPNLNQAYMAGLMTAPMVVIELVLMGSMYGSRRLNAFIVVASLVLGASCWVLIRQQVAITDREFLKSMIPHHAGAILMCEQASLEDPEIRELCRSIRSGQQSEIDFMKAKLDALER
jgi:uncharacterized protein (DUF305 family)